MPPREQGFWLPKQKRGSIAIFDGVAWRVMSLSGATVSYSANTITITSSAGGDDQLALLAATALG